MTVRLKALKREQEKTEAVNGLLDMFNLPRVSSQGYQVRPNPRPELTGGSATPGVSTEQLKLKDRVRLTPSGTAYIDTDSSSEPATTCKTEAVRGLLKMFGL